MDNIQTKLAVGDWISEPNHLSGTQCQTCAFTGQAVTSQPDQMSTKSLPITSYQHMLLAAAQDAETSPGYHQHQIVRWAFKISPGVAPRTLRRAFDRLVARHDSLRLRFTETDGEWRAVIQPKHTSGLLVEDMSHLSGAALTAAIVERALQPLTALSDPMFEMILIKCGKEGDVLVTRANHAIMDGYSVVVLIEELLKIVVNIPLTGKPPTHAEFMVLRETQLQEREAEKETFWEELLLPLPDDQNIGRRAKGMPPVATTNVNKTRQLDNILTAEQSAALEANAKARGVSSFSCLHAAFSETVCNLGGQDEVLVTSVLGRQNAKIAGFIGADNLALMVRYVSTPSGLFERAKRVSDQISQAASNVPTLAFRPGHTISNAFAEKNMARFRFIVNMPQPTGRLSNSPFKKLFQKRLEDKVSFGFATLQRFELPGDTQTDHELGLMISTTENGANATLIADSLAFSDQDLIEISGAIKQQMQFSRN